MGVSGPSAAQSPANALLQKAAAAKTAKAGADLNQKILDKAAASNAAQQDQKNAKLRSLSPLGILDDDKDAKLEKMLEEERPDDDSTPAERQDSTDQKGESQDRLEKDEDKTI